jgi:protein SCO1/2
MTDPRRRRYPGLMLAAAALLVAAVAAGAALWSSQGGGPSIGGPFTLVDGDGRTVTDRDFRGKWLLIYFGYTFCPDVCPTTLNEVAAALGALGPKADRLTPVFITVDPGRDTRPVVKQYAAAFSPRMVGLTGSAEQIAAVAKEYRVYYAIHRTGDNPGNNPGDYSVDHTSLLYLVDPDGRFVAPIRADLPGAEMAAAIARYL